MDVLYIIWVDLANDVYIAVWSGWMWLRMSSVVAPAVALDLCLAPGSCADREGRWLIASEGTVAGIINGCRINLFSLVCPLVWATLVAGRFFLLVWSSLAASRMELCLSFHQSLCFVFLFKCLENSHPQLAISANSKLCVAGGID